VSQRTLRLVANRSAPLFRSAPPRAARDAHATTASSATATASAPNGDDDPADGPAASDEALDAACAAQASPCMRLYHRWRLLFGKLRAGIGPQRARAVEAMLHVYPEDTLALALDGAADDAWIRDRGAQFTSIEWILANEQRIERFADAGAALHAAIARRAEAAAHARQRRGGGAGERAASEVSDADGATVLVTPAAAAMAAQARARLQALRDELARRAAR